MSASHRPAADFESVSRTFCRSNAERLMTLSTSAVAVCCCSDSLRSSRALPDLIEQADVLDRDHGLVGKGLEKLDLVVGEWSGSGARDPDGADRDAVAQHRHAKDAPIAAERAPISLTAREYVWFGFDVSADRDRARQRRPRL